MSPLPLLNHKQLAAAQLVWQTAATTSGGGLYGIHRFNPLKGLFTIITITTTTIVSKYFAWFPPQWAAGTFPVPPLGSAS